ncbi:MAG: response regulator transcription factor [Bacteroidia bacterium]|nr:response regulator transcription factor [Bacteroidia bacterium]
MSPKILIIEDEISLQETLKLNLEFEQYEVKAVGSWQDAQNALQHFVPHLLLLDIMLPDVDGIEIYKQLRAKNYTFPIIFLTAKSNIKDKIEGLKLGADDYITKPFELEELLLRVSNVLKRQPFNEKDLTTLSFNQCEINFITFEIKTINGKTETLPKREIALLKLLTDKENEVVSRDEILEKLWTKDENPSSRTIDNYILNFRKLFEVNPKDPKHFHSIRGVGYKFIA